jgi:hypothetical protein
MEERVTTYAKWAADLSDLPPACGAEPEPLGTPEAVRERIAEIPTRLGRRWNATVNSWPAQRPSWSPSTVARSLSS